MSKRDEALALADALTPESLDDGLAIADVVAAAALLRQQIEDMREFLKAEGGE